MMVRFDLKKRKILDYIKYRRENFGGVFGVGENNFIVNKNVIDLFDKVYHNKNDTKSLKKILALVRGIKKNYTKIERGFVYRQGLYGVKKLSLSEITLFKTTALNVRQSICDFRILKRVVGAKTFR